MDGFSKYSNEQDFIKTSYDSTGAVIEKCSYADYKLIDCDLKMYSGLIKPRFDSVCIGKNKNLATDCSEYNLLYWLSHTVKYPVMARDNGVMGNAIVRFTIEKDGSLTNINVIRGFCQPIKDELIRVLKSSPPWIPGKDKDGEFVRVYFTLPVSFKLE